MKRSNLILLIIVIILWGLNWIVMKIGVGIAGPLTFTIQKFSLASFALIPILVYLRKEMPRDRYKWVHLTLLSLINTVSVVCVSIGMTYEKSGIGSVLTYTQSIFVFFLAVPILKEEINTTKLLGTILGFSGVMLLYIGSSFSLTTAIQSTSFVLVGAFLWALAAVYYKKFLTQVDPVVTNFIELALGAAFLLIPTVTLEGLYLNLTNTYFFMILYASIFTLAIGFSLWTFLIKEEKVGVISASSLLVPMLALILGWSILQEPIEPVQTVGCGLILIGIYFVHRKHVLKNDY